MYNTAYPVLPQIIFQGGSDGKCILNEFFDSNSCTFLIYEFFHAFRSILKQHMCKIRLLCQLTIASMLYFLQWSLTCNEIAPAFWNLAMFKPPYVSVSKESKGCLVFTSLSFTKLSSKVVAVTYILQEMFCLSKLSRT